MKTQDSSNPSRNWLFPWAFPVLFPIIFPILFPMLFMSFFGWGHMGDDFFQKGSSSYFSTNGHCSEYSSDSSNSMEVLKTRYANGDITKEEYLKIKKELEL